MDAKKNLCAQIPVELHAKVREEQERSGQPLGEYITDVLTRYYKTQQQGESAMNENMRTLAFQVPEEMFQRLKDYLAWASEQTGRKLSQKEFVLGLIEQALNEAELEMYGEDGPGEDEESSQEQENGSQEQTDLEQGEQEFDEETYQAERTDADGPEFESGGEEEFQSAGMMMA